MNTYLKQALVIMVTMAVVYRVPQVRSIVVGS